MRKTALFALTLTLSADAYAADLNGMHAADIKSAADAGVPAVSIARTFRPQPAFAASVCETAVAKTIGFRQTAFRDARGQQLKGFDKAYYTENGPMQVSLVLQTGKEAFYYYQDCDICAEVDKCDLRTGAVTRVAAGHSVDCSDLAKYSAGAVYSACPSGPACSAVGEDVRIPEECCSKNAEPNQNGEMTCVAAKPSAGAPCSAVGEDVRIPEECCSKNAEPNQNGEMTCVAAAQPSCSAVGEDVRIPEECCSKNAEPNENGEMTCIPARSALKSPFLR